LGLDPDSPLFVQLEGKNKGEGVTRSSVSNLIVQLAKKAGLKKVSAHSMRRFHTTFLQVLELAIRG